MKVIARLVFENVYCDVTVQNVSYSAMGTRPWGSSFDWIRQSILEKGNYEFKLYWLLKKLDLVSHPWLWKKGLGKYIWLESLFIVKLIVYDRVANNFKRPQSNPVWDGSSKRDRDRERERERERKREREGREREGRRSKRVRQGGRKGWRERHELWWER